MKFADALANAAIPMGRTCLLCDELSDHPEADQIWAAILGEDYSVPVVRRALNDAGIKVGTETVRRHRRRECRTRGLQ